MKAVNVTRTKRRLLLIAVAVTAASAALAAALALANSSSGSQFDATAPFAVFRDTPPITPPADFASAHSLAQADLRQVHQSARGLGRFDSQLLIVPANDGRSVCYAVLASAADGPAASYCFSPGDSRLPAGLAAEHFSVVPLESRIEGVTTAYLFGVAFDDVARIRVDVAGQWRTVPVVHNGFYVELPGVALDQVGHLEATLRGGRVQAHDLRTGTSVP